MKAAVLTIGTELTRGELVNGNAAWLGDELTTLGLEVVEHTTVDDDKPRIVEALRRLAHANSVLVLTGGLGPTSDDLTAEAVADALGVPTERDETSLARIRQRWAALGKVMPESNVKQADMPRGARVLTNNEGTAPGFEVELGDARIFALPGVPREMKRMFRDHVLPAIAPSVTRTTHQLHLRTFGMTESQIADVLADVEGQNPGIIVGYRAHFPEIEIKVLARGASESDAERLARQVTGEIRRRLGSVVYGEREDTFASAVGRTLRDRGLCLAVAESCTGGLIGAMLTSVPGSSDYLVLDAVVYANSAKSKLLGVSTDTLRAYGAVSSETASAMAEGALRLAEADIAVAVTGIAGPGGATDDKPVGTVWLALARKNAPTFTKRYQLAGDRERIRIMASFLALRLVSRSALGHPLEE